MASEAKSPTGTVPDPEVSATFEQLRGEVRELENDVRTLHEQLNRIYERLQQAPATGGIELADLELPPPAPPDPLFGRALRKIARISARTVRGVVKALSPAHVPLHTLRLVDDQRVAPSLPSIGVGEEHEVIVEGDELCAGRLEDLRRLFSTEAVDAAVIGAMIARRRGVPGWTGRVEEGLARTASALGRAVIFKNLDLRSGRATEIDLRPSGPGDASSIWRGDPYLVALPKDERQAQLRVARQCPPLEPCPSECGSVLIVVGQPLANGLELRVGAVCDAARARSQEVTVVSLAPPGQPGDRRLDALDRLGCKTAALGATLHPVVHASAAAGLATASGARLLWAIGEGRALGDVVRSCAAANSGLKVLWEPLGVPEDVFAEAAVVIARCEEQRSGISDLCDHAEVVLAPTPVTRHDCGGDLVGGEAFAPGRRLVLWADDLCPESRPEDAVALARCLQEHEDTEVWMAGDGSMVDTVADLARVFHLENFRIIAPGAHWGQLVARADVLCVTHESPLMTASAAAALGCGTPVVSVDVQSEQRDAARAADYPFWVAGPPGDARALAKTVLEVLAHPRSEHRGEQLEAQAAEARAALVALLER